MMQHTAWLATKFPVVYIVFQLTALFFSFLWYAVNAFVVAAAVPGGFVCFGSCVRLTYSSLFIGFLNAQC